jgi:hypothetical protein
VSKVKECARNTKAKCVWKVQEERKLIIMTNEKISQKLSLDFETKLIELQGFATGLHQRNKYSLSQIGNEDETADFSTCLTVIPQI